MDYRRTIKKTMIASAQISLIFTLISLPLFAAPSISSVSGIIANGQTINIVGSGFGSGPTVFLFDDFEKGTNGSTILSGTGSAQVGKWDDVSEGPCTYSNTYKLSGSLAFRGNFNSYDWGSIEANFPANTRKVYGSWWWYIPAGTPLPGQGTTDGLNWKTVWIYDTISNNNITLPNIHGDIEYHVFGNNLQYPLDDWIILNYSSGKWMHIQAYVEVNSDGRGKVKLWELTTSGVIQRMNASGSWNNGNPFRTISFNAMGRKTPNCYPYFDDVYVAIGDNALARIEIGNNPVYENCTKLTKATPDSWTTSSITAKVRQGAFSSSENAYLFVIDSTGNASPGYPIQFNSAGSVGNGDSISPAIQITAPTSNNTYQTTSNKITLSGTASDNIGVASVTWANDRGGSGTASGTTSWTCSNISLQQGSNVITVTARDAAGNASTDTITVTYTDSTSPSRPSGVSIQIIN